MASQTVSIVVDQRSGLVDVEASPRHVCLCGTAFSLLLTMLLFGWYSFGRPTSDMQPYIEFNLTNYAANTPLGEVCAKDGCTDDTPLFWEENKTGYTDINAGTTDAEILHHYRSLGLSYSVTYHTDSESQRTYTMIRREERKNQAALVYLPGFSQYSNSFEFALRVRGFLDVHMLDMVRYGRSYIRDGVDKDGNEYNYQDDYTKYHEQITHIIEVVKAMGYSKVILGGNSNGGLITSSYVRKHAAKVDAVLLNAPFIAGIQDKLVLGTLSVPTVVASAAGRVMPKLIVSHNDINGSIGLYSELLFQKAFYNETHTSANATPYRQDRLMAIRRNGPTYLGWLRAVIIEQNAIAAASYSFDKPCIMLIAQSRASKWPPLGVPFAKWSEYTGDHSLDPDQVREMAPKVYKDLTVHSYEMGLHDMFLTDLNTFESVVDKLHQWMSTKLLLS